MTYALCLTRASPNQTAPLWVIPQSKDRVRRTTVASLTALAIGAAIDNQLVGPPPAVRHGLGLAQDLEHVGYRFLDGLHDNLPSCFVGHAMQAKHLLAQHAKGGGGYI